MSKREIPDYFKYVKMLELGNKLVCIFLKAHMLICYLDIKCGICGTVKTWILSEIYY